MGDTLRWEPRWEDNEWNNQCEYLKEGDESIGVVWYSLRAYKEEGPNCVYKKDQWYYASIAKADGDGHEATSQEEAKALCIMLCKLNQ